MADINEESFSASLPADVAERVRMIAQEENRSPSNVIECAVKVFTLLPKDVRDFLLKASADHKAGRDRVKEFARIAMYQDAVCRLDAAITKAAPYLSQGSGLDDYEDAVVEYKP